ncbi:MAG: tetratricopeptide repeat protein [Stigonema ocellatum SAG 48.90 = DSM 106950]|nr:tetratricopeptide repeat protein [Stigonema ocellatum SAG 48.90 = DSM 106950]
MNILFCGSTGEQITLTIQIAISGEGTVWYTNQNGYLAKVYHSLDQERVEKLKVMVAHPPLDPNYHIPHISFAWPKSLLKDSNGCVLGFLMPEITGSVELINIYNSLQRQKLKLEIDWTFLHTVCQNIASIIQVIHVSGYVLGDIKSQNILVNNRALPSIIDTDSFQVRHPNNSHVYHCLVGSEGFTPVELLGQDFSTVEQTEVHDRFRLAVIIYLLLFGNHPFQGQWIGTGDSPEPTELVRSGFWPYSLNSLIEPSPRTIPLNIVHPEIQRCFLRCFNDGHTQPHLRPTAQEWKNALESARNQLIACNLVDSHQYSQSYGKCYWCERASNIKFDAFPGNAIPQPQSISAPQSNSPMAAQHFQSNILSSDQVSELLQQKGQEVTVVGQVFKIHSRNNKMLFINFMYSSFTVVIFQECLSKLSKANKLNINKLNSYEGKYIKITGLIENYQSSKNKFFPQIVLQNPAQFSWITKSNAKKILAKAINQLSASAKTFQGNQSSLQPENQAIICCKNGRICARQGNYQEALKHYNKALSLKPDYDIAYYYRGVVYENLGVKSKAINDFQEAAKLGVKLASLKLR